MKKIKNPGIKEIAALAGVSIGTVDRVLHNRGRVSAETKQKVKDIVRQIDYKPNLLARSLVTNKETTVAILVPDPHEDEYWKQAFEGIELTAVKWALLGIALEYYFYSLDNRESFNNSAAKILKDGPSGVIMAPNFLEEGRSFLELCRGASIPVIMFDTSIPGTQPLSCIGTDSFQSGKVAAQLLTMSSRESGKFAILHFDEERLNSPHMLEKERGFLAYLKAESPQRKYITLVLNNKKHYYHGQLKGMFEKENISGIFVSTSKTYRIGTYFLTEKISGVRLVGYDLITNNIELLQGGFIDFLINQNPRRQAEQSVNTFGNYLVYKESVDPKKLFPIEIIVKNNLASYL